MATCPPTPVFLPSQGLLNSSAWARHLHWQLQGAQSQAVQKGGIESPAKWMGAETRSMVRSGEVSMIGSMHRRRISMEHEEFIGVDA